MPYYKRNKPNKRNLMTEKMLKTQTVKWLQSLGYETETELLLPSKRRIDIVAYKADKSNPTKNPYFDVTTVLVECKVVIDSYAPLGQIMYYMNEFAHYRKWFDDRGKYSGVILPMLSYYYIDYRYHTLLYNNQNVRVLPIQAELPAKAKQSSAIKDYLKSHDERYPRYPKGYLDGYSSTEDEVDFESLMNPKDYEVCEFFSSYSDYALTDGYIPLLESYDDDNT